jgi:hypothetical protein
MTRDPFRPLEHGLGDVWRDSRRLRGWIRSVLTDALAPCSRLVPRVLGAVFGVGVVAGPVGDRCHRRVGLIRVARR